MSACLQARGISCVALDRAPSVGASWRNHYERLHLHTSKGLSALPYLPFPKEAARYPSREEVVAYLERYATHFGLAPRFGERVAWFRLEPEVRVHINAPAIESFSTNKKVLLVFYALPNGNTIEPCGNKSARPAAKRLRHARSTTQDCGTVNRVRCDGSTST